MSPKERFIRLSKKVLIFLAAGLLYYIWIRLTDIAVPCLIHTFTGLKCPGCGITSCFVSLISLDLKAAFEANALITILLPFAIPYGIYKGIVYIKTGKIRYSPAENIVFIILSIIALIFAVCRNIVDSPPALWHH